MAHLWIHSNDLKDVSLVDRYNLFSSVDAHSSDCWHIDTAPITVSYKILNCDCDCNCEYIIIRIEHYYYHLVTGNQAFINLQFLIVDIIRHFIYILMVEDGLPDS